MSEKNGTIFLKTPNQIPHYRHYIYRDPPPAVEFHATNGFLTFGRFHGIIRISGRSCALPCLLLIFIQKGLIHLKKKIRDKSLYFRQKDIARPLGGALTVIGLVWFYFGMTMASYYIPCIITPIGVILFIVGGSRLITDNDMSEQIEHAMLDYDKEITDMNGYDRVVLRQPAPVETKAYDFGETASYFKKGKNGTLISDQYVGAHFFYTKEGILVVGRRLSIAALNGEEAGIENFTATLAFTEIRSAKLEEHATPINLSNTGKSMTVKWYELVVTAAAPDAGELLRIPVKNDMDAAGICEEINRRSL